jgi:universal stress protein A
MISIKRMLVPTDFSGPSNAALAYAVALAQAVGGHLYLLHVPGTIGENFEAAFPFGPFEAAPRHALEPIAAADVRTTLRPEFAVRIGRAADEIVRYAGDRDIDLVVMSTHGRGGVAHLLMGSVAEEVIRKAQCPVVVVPQARHQGK